MRTTNYTHTKYLPEVKIFVSNEEMNSLNGISMRTVKDYLFSLPKFSKVTYIAIKYIEDAPPNGFNIGVLFKGELTD